MNILSTTPIFKKYHIHENIIVATFKYFGIINVGIYDIRFDL